MKQTFNKQGSKRKTEGIIRRNKEEKEEERKRTRKEGASKQVEVCLFAVGWLLKRPSNTLVYLRDGSAQTIVLAATLR